MKITRKRASVIYDVFEEELERRCTEADEIAAEIEACPRTALWERERKQVADRLQRLPKLVHEAASAIHVEWMRGGQPSTPSRRRCSFCSPDSQNAAIATWRRC